MLRLRAGPESPCLKWPMAATCPAATVLFRARCAPGREIMSGPVIRSALEFLLKSSNHRHLAVDFFGGEPLLNLAGIREVWPMPWSHGQDGNWKFTLTTNTLLFDEQICSFTARP